MHTATEFIAFAIQNKKILIFNYQGSNRKVAPYHYGILNGKAQLHAYQIGGLSRSGRPIGWKNFEIKKMKDLHLDDHGFHPRADHHPANSNYSKIEKSIVLEKEKK